MVNFRATVNQEIESDGIRIIIRGKDYVSVEDVGRFRDWLIDQWKKHPEVVE
jgi:hypothetical protein